MKRVLAWSVLIACAAAAAAFAEGAGGPTGAGLASVAQRAPFFRPVADPAAPIAVPDGIYVRSIPSRLSDQAEFKVAGFREELRAEPLVRITGQSRQTVYDLPTGGFDLLAGSDEWKLQVPSRASVIGLDGRPMMVQDVYQGEWIVVEGHLTGPNALQVVTIQKLAAPITESQLLNTPFSGTAGPSVEVAGPGRESFVTPPGR